MKRAWALFGFLTFCIGCLPFAVKPRRADKSNNVTERTPVEKLKNEFVSVVSHELRTPLTSIRGALSLLLSGSVGEQTEKARKLLTIANNNCDRLLVLISDILDIEKIEAGTMAFPCVPVDVAALIEETIEANKMYAEKFSVAVQFARPNAYHFVYADAGRLLQVITNLLSNAIKFTPTGGGVNIAVTQVDTKVRVSVTDHGAGVPAAFRAVIFEKFSQADSSAARDQNGTGLGLSISKAIVENFGGSIHFTSEPGQATVFYFDLPVWQGKHVEATNKLLICEDSSEQAEYLRELLTSVGIHADIAATAAEAKALLAKNHYQGLLLDLLLPDQDGITLIRQLREDEATRALPIVVMSVLAKTGRELLSGDALAVIDWLDKPVDFNQLVTSIERIKKSQPDRLPRILHVEDDMETGQIIATLLQDSAVVVGAENLRVARKKLADETFDLIILDLLLPDGNGTELLPLLTLRRLPVIVFSAMELDQDYARYVTQILNKANTSKTHFINMIKSLIEAAI